jgi:hypothetical protein
MRAGVTSGAGRLWQGTVKYCVIASGGTRRLQQVVLATGNPPPIHVMATQHHGTETLRVRIMNGAIGNSTATGKINCCPDECPPAGCPGGCSVC